MITASPMPARPGITAPIRLEIDLLHGDSIDGLRLDVLDPVDVGADRILAVGGKTLLHLGRVEAGVLPDHRDHRDVDLGENIGRHLDGSSDAEKQDQGGDHIKGMRKFQRKANDSQSMLPLSPGPTLNSRFRSALIRAE